MNKATAQSDKQLLSLCQSNDFRQLLISSQKAIRKNPKSIFNWFMLGQAFRGLQHWINATQTFQHVLALDPQHEQARLGLAISFASLGAQTEAVSQFEQLVQKTPHNLSYLSQLISASSELLLAPEAYKRLALVFGNQVSALNGEPQTTWPQAMRRENQPLRIGLVSGDFKMHPVGVFLHSLLSNSGNQIEFYAYDNCPTIDELARKLKQHCAVWRSINVMSDKAAAELIAQDDIQILIDLSGHTAYSRLGIFALKPAPIQITWLGYHATTGVTQIDYILTDALSVPIHHADHFCEKVAYLPRTRFCYGEYLRVNAPEVKRSENASCVLGVFQKPSKFSDEILQAWAEILTKLPDAVLRLHRPIYLDAELRKFILRRFAHFGISSQCIEFKYDFGYTQYLDYYNHVDVVLDTYPFNGATTNFEALWMGVPILTWAGNNLMSRQTLSILNTVGLSEWVAHSKDEYVQTAVRLLSKPTELASLHEQIIQTARPSCLFDGQMFAADFTHTMQELWSKLASSQTER